MPVAGPKDGDAFGSVLAADAAGASTPESLFAGRAFARRQPRAVPLRSVLNSAKHAANNVNAIPSHSARLAQLSVALFRCPIADRATEGAHPQWLGQRGDPDIVEVAQQDRAHTGKNEEAEHADIDPQDAAGDDGQQRQQRSGEQQIRKHDDRERPYVRKQRYRPQTLGVDPRHELGDEDAETDQRIDQQTAEHRCGDPAGDVIATLDRAGEDQFGGALLEIAQQRAVDRHRDEQHADEGEDAQKLDDDHRRIAMDIADTATELDHVGRGRAERERGEQRTHHPQQR